MGLNQGVLTAAERTMSRDRSSIGEYLRARRALVQPEDVGIARGAKRRVAGLRRQEVADLAGISLEYYLRLEQGRDRHPSTQVVHALARALLLDQVGTLYLERLARPAPIATSGAARKGVLPGDLPMLLEQWSGMPAFVTDSNLDVVYANRMAEKVMGTGFLLGANRVLAMFSPEYRAAVPGWIDRAAEVVGALRMRGNPEDPRFQELVGGLAVRSREFRRLWARQDVHVLTRGAVGVPVQPFGVIELQWRNLQVAEAPGWALTTVFAERGSTAAAALAFLAAAEGLPTTSVPARSHLGEKVLEPEL